MSTMTPTRFGPYKTPAELAKGRRKTILSLAVALVAVVLAVVASRTVADGRLVTVYLVAGVMHFCACVAAAVRWSRTPEFDEQR
jgi:hypothetical protein